MRLASHFVSLDSNEAKKPDGVWNWAKRLIDALNRWRLFELMDVAITDKPLNIIRVNSNGTGYEYAPEELGFTNVDLTGKGGYTVKVKMDETGFELVP